MLKYSIFDILKNRQLIEPKFKVGDRVKITLSERQYTFCKCGFGNHLFRYNELQYFNNCTVKICEVYNAIEHTFLCASKTCNELVDFFQGEKLLYAVKTIVSDDFKDKIKNHDICVEFFFEDELELVN